MKYFPTFLILDMMLILSMIIMCKNHYCDIWWVKCIGLLFVWGIGFYGGKLIGKYGMSRG